MDKVFFLQMAGFPGSGKSTLAREVSKHTGAVVLDHDVTKSAFIQSLENTEIDGKVVGAVTYDVEWALIDSLLAQGHSVIFDSPCFYTEGLENGISLAEKHGAEYKYVECYIDNIEEVNKRLKQRERLMSQIESIELEVVFTYSIHNSKKPEQYPHIRVYSSEPLDSYIHKVLAYIAE
nr:ATP-binding protein [Priestia taiwanensis]